MGCSITNAYFRVPWFKIYTVYEWIIASRGRIFSQFENELVASWEWGKWEKHWELVPSLTKNTASGAAKLFYQKRLRNTVSITCRPFVIVKKSELRHAAKFKLPSGKVLVAVPGGNTFETKDFIFKMYYVSSIWLGCFIIMPCFNLIEL